jgi:hypothetical protein
MLLFRSEETVTAWCRERQIPPRPIITMPQLWHLSVAWYANRLTVESRRPAPDEMVGIFAQAGLEGPFWDPKSDHWTVSPRG